MSAEAEARRLTIIGLALMLCLAGVCMLIAIKPFDGGRQNNHISIVMDLPYVGQGVTTGTAMIMHGVKVGEVTAVLTRPDGGVRLNVDLQSGPTSGLTESLGVDFRPANYFGVTGINLVPSAGGQALRDGTRIDPVPQGNFTLQALLYRLGEITGGVVTPRLIQVMDRATRYTDALNPLIETMLISADAVAKVQTVSSEQLLRNATGVSVAFPSFLQGLTGAGDYFTRGSGFVTFLEDDQGALRSPAYANLIPVVGQPHSEEYWQKRTVPFVQQVADSFYGAVGKLLSSHPDALIPATELVKTLTDVVPGLVTPENVASDLVELRTRFEKLYAGSPEQRAVQVHIVLDNLPGVAAPLGVMGGP